MGIIYVWPASISLNMCETRVLICSGEPPLRWLVDNNICSVNRHFNRKGLYSPKAALLKPCSTGSCKVSCYDAYNNYAETTSITVLPFNKVTAKNAHDNIFIGVEVRKQLGKSFIFRRRFSHQEKYSHFVPFNPQGLIKQQPWRQLFAAAMASAMALGSDEREKWRLENRRYLWFNNYIKWYLKQQPKPW